MSNEVGFRYGVIQPSLEAQAKAQGYALKNHDIHEKRREALSLVYFADLITDSQYDMALRKLNKRVVADLTKEQN